MSNSSQQNFSSDSNLQNPQGQNSYHNVYPGPQPFLGTNGNNSSQNLQNFVPPQESKNLSTGKLPPAISDRYNFLKSIEPKRSAQPPQPNSTFAPIDSPFANLNQPQSNPNQPQVPTNPVFTLPTASTSNYSSFNSTNQSSFVPPEESSYLKPPEAFNPHPSNVSEKMETKLFENDVDYYPQNQQVQESGMDPETLKAIAQLQKDEQSKNREEQIRETYYSNTLLVGIAGLVFYFIGSCFLIFFRNIDGRAQVVLPSYPLSWELFFTNFGEFLNRLFGSVFGYFIQYAKLFGFFKEIGTISGEVRPRFLFPVDIFIKLATIFYFNIRWSKWDTQRLFELGAFNSNFNKKVKEREPRKDDDELERQIQQITAQKNIQMDNGLVSQNTKIDFDDDEDEDVGIRGILPFEGVGKPIEEWYYRNEEKVYRLIRNNLLPGTNLVLVLYFSTLFVLDLKEPLGVVGYILGIMSMFWCMQTFVSILDHNQYQPEDETEDEDEEN